MNTAQKFLLENKCSDLVLNDKPQTKKGEYIYASDLMLKFAENEKQKMLKDLKEKTNYNWSESIASELGDFLDKHIIIEP